ncbi:MAG: hypothetical protein AAF903_10610 [Pseudomonadota bacterium]
MTHASTPARRAQPACCSCCFLSLPAFAEAELHHIRQISILYAAVWRRASDGVNKTGQGRDVLLLFGVSNFAFPFFLQKGAHFVGKAVTAFVRDAVEILPIHGVTNPALRPSGEELGL